MRKSSLALTLLASLLLGACATEPLPTRFDASALVEGEIALACETPRCAFFWQARQKTMTELYDAEDWRSLAQMVASLGYPTDLAHFYLGRAAEELDAPSAAAIYFDRALLAERKCEDSFFDQCPWVDVPKEARQRRQRIAALLAPPEMDLTEAQTRLSQLGLYTITIDGVSGPHTVAAIETFQERQGIPRSGELDAPTRSALAKTDTSGTVVVASAAPSPKPNPRPEAKPKQAPASARVVDERTPADADEAQDAEAPVATSGVDVQLSPSANAPTERTRVTVEVDLLSDADPFADVVEVVEQGSWVDVIDWGDEWSRVSHGNKVGYVYTEILQ